MSTAKSSPAVESCPFLACLLSARNACARLENEVSGAVNHGGGIVWANLRVQTGRGQLFFHSGLLIGLMKSTHMKLRNRERAHYHRRCSTNHMLCGRSVASGERQMHMWVRFPFSNYRAFLFLRSPRRRRVRSSKSPFSRLTVS